MKVLVSAFVCRPNFSAEATVGWEWATHLCREHDLVVITKPWDRDDATLGRVLMPNLRMEFCPLPRWCRIFDHNDDRQYIFYLLWQLAAYFRARRLVRTERFDLVHHLVYVSTWQPTLMAFLGLPFVFGPLGEHALMPRRFSSRYGWKVLLREIFERSVKVGLKLYSPLQWATYRRARQVVAVSEEVRTTYPRSIQAKTTVQPAVAGFEEPPAARARDGCFRVLFAGRFVYRKAPDLALQAFLRFAAGRSDVRLDMIGGGPLHHRLEEIRLAHPAGTSVEIIGWSERSRIRERMEGCDVFLFPSFEGAGMVAMEAMSLAKPVVCAAFGGPGQYVPHSAGVHVPATNADDMIESLAEALELLYRNDELRISMGKAGRRAYQEKYSWERKVSFMSALYRKACQA